MNRYVCALYDEDHPSLCGGEVEPVEEIYVEESGESYWLYACALHTNDVLGTADSAENKQ